MDYTNLDNKSLQIEAIHYMGAREELRRRVHKRIEERLPAVMRQEGFPQEKYQDIFDASYSSFDSGFQNCYDGDVLKDPNFSFISGFIREIYHQGCLISGRKPILKRTPQTL